MLQSKVLQLQLNVSSLKDKIDHLQSIINNKKDGLIIQNQFKCNGQTSVHIANGRDTELIISALHDVLNHWYAELHSNVEKVKAIQQIIDHNE